MGGIHSGHYCSVYNVFLPTDLSLFCRDVFTNRDIPIVAVGCGKAIAERVIMEDTRRVILVDPQQNPTFQCKNIPKEWTNYRVPTTKFPKSVALWEDVTVIHSMKPEYPTVTDLLAAEPEIVGKCYMFIAKPYIGRDSFYDYDALDLLRPVSMVMMYQSDGCDGGFKMHTYLHLIGAPAASEDVSQMSAEEAYEKGHDAVMAYADKRGISKSLVNNYSVHKKKVRRIMDDQENRDFLMQMNGRTYNEYTLLALKTKKQQSLQYEEEYDFVKMMTAVKPEIDWFNDVWMKVEKTPEVLKLLNYGVGLEQYKIGGITALPKVIPHEEWPSSIPDKEEDADAAAPAAAAAAAGAGSGSC